MTDLSRNDKQVKNAGQMLNEKESKNECASLLTLAKDIPSIRNLQWTPSLRVAFCKDEQLDEIVRMLFCIVTKHPGNRYHLQCGDFYVTSTS